MALIRPPKKDGDFKESYWRIAHVELNYPENSEKNCGIVRLAGFESSEARKAGKHLTCLYPPILLGSKDFPHDGQRVDFYAAVKLACPYFADALDDNVATPAVQPDLPADPVALDAVTDEALASDAALDEHHELFSGVPEPAPDPLDVARAINARLLSKDDDLPAPGAPLSDWEAGEGVGNVEAAAVPAPTSTVPESIAALIEPGETLAEARRRLTEILNIELAELVLARGTNKENLEREAEIQHLRNLLARIGEA